MTARDANDIARENGIDALRAEFDGSLVPMAEAPQDEGAPARSAAGLGEWDAGDDTGLPPPRGWLLGNVFARGFMSSLLADGGTGKTALRYAQLLSLAIGRSLTGEHVFQRCRVLIISLEDDAKELRRRILAVMLHQTLIARRHRNADRASSQRLQHPFRAPAALPPAPTPSALVLGRPCGSRDSPRTCPRSGADHPPAPWSPALAAPIARRPPATWQTFDIPHRPVCGTRQKRAGRVNRLGFLRSCHSQAIFHFFLLHGRRRR